MHNSLDTSQVSELCKSCGLCCDGTLFNRAKIFEDKDIELASQNNMEIILTNDIPHIKLPCPNFKSCCTIYQKEKPSVCNVFFCAPLRKYENNTLEWNQATNIIKNTKLLRDEIISLAKNINELQSLNQIGLFQKLDKIVENITPQDYTLLGNIIVKYIHFKNTRKSMFKDA